MTAPSPYRLPLLVALVLLAAPLTGSAAEDRSSHLATALSQHRERFIESLKRQYRTQAAIAGVELNLEALELTKQGDRLVAFVPTSNVTELSWDDLREERAVGIFFISHPFENLSSFSGVGSPIVESGPAGFHIYRAKYLPEREGDLSDVRIRLTGPYGEVRGQVFGKRGDRKPNDGIDYQLTLNQGWTTVYLRHGELRFYTKMQHSGESQDSSPATRQVLKTAREHERRVLQEAKHTAREYGWEIDATQAAALTTPESTVLLIARPDLARFSTRDFESGVVAGLMYGPRLLPPGEDKLEERAYRLRIIRLPNSPDYQMQLLDREGRPRYGDRAFRKRNYRGWKAGEGARVRIDYGYGIKAYLPWGPGAWKLRIGGVLDRLMDRVEK